MFEIKLFTKRQDMEDWLMYMNKHYSITYNEIFVNNAYAVEYKFNKVISFD